jgi:hypothetical protein
MKMENNRKIRSKVRNVGGGEEEKMSKKVEKKKGKL